MLRGRAAKRKKEDVTEYMQKAVALIHQYVPPNPATLQKVFQAGRTGVQILEPGRRGRLDFRDYLIPGDVLGVEVNLTNNKILGLQVGTYIDKPEDAVSLKVQFATLADGTGYPAQVTPRRDEAERPRGHTEHRVPARTAVRLCCAQSTTDQPHDRRGVTP